MQVSWASGGVRAALVTVVTAATLLTTGVAGAATNPAFLPPSGKVFLGVEGYTTPQQFQALTGARHSLSMRSLSWGQGVDYGKRYSDWLAESGSGDYRMMFHLTTTKRKREIISPGAIAAGRGDAYLIAVSRELNDSGQVVYVRPMAEMNGHWNVWSAFNENGTRRNAAHSTRAFRNAFRRITLIMRGGSVTTINARLRASGMPTLRSSASALPASGLVAMVFNPQGEGKPNVRGNQPRDYYPGDAYTDFVGNDLYSIRFNANFKAHERLYNAFPRKPFMVVEWAPWNTDDPAFVDRMFAWVASHPRTKALMYFDGNSSNLFRLRIKPRSLARYRAHARKARFRCVADGCGAQPAGTASRLAR